MFIMNLNELVVQIFFELKQKIKDNEFLFMKDPL